MKTLAVLLVVGIGFLVGIRFAGVTTDIPALDRAVIDLMTSVGVH